MKDMSLRTCLLALSLSLASGCDEGPEGEVEVPIGDPDYPRDPALDVALTSRHGGDEGHRAGENCMACHQAHGPGPGRFSVAGTVYGADGAPSPDATVELWTEPAGQGELVLAVEADASGNFYTTAEIDLAEVPRFPFVRAADGVGANLMPFPTRSGACNVCHAGGSINPVDLP